MFRKLTLLVTIFALAGCGNINIPAVNNANQNTPKVTPTEVPVVINKPKLPDITLADTNDLTTLQSVFPDMVAPVTLARLVINGIDKLIFAIEDGAGFIETDLKGFTHWITNNNQTANMIYSDSEKTFYVIDNGNNGTLYFRKRLIDEKQCLTHACPPKKPYQIPSLPNCDDVEAQIQISCKSYMDINNSEVKLIGTFER